jgi:chain length determinant protein EpsF
MTSQNPTLTFPPTDASLLSFEQATSVLRARWLSLLMTLLVAYGLGTAALLFLPKRYQATATVLLDVKSADPISGLMMQGVLAASSSYMNTQVDLIGSETIGRRVVRELGLAQVPELAEEWRKEALGSGDLEGWLAETIGKHLDVTPKRESNLLRVSYTATDPAQAARLANAYVKAYVDTTLDLRVAPARQYKEFFDSSGEQLRQALEQAQRRLSDYQQQHGLIGTEGDALDVESSRLNAMVAQLVLLQSQAADSSSRQQQARHGADAMQEALSNPLVSALRGDLQRARSRLSELESAFSDQHPQVIQLKAQISEMELRIAEETRRVSRGVDSSSTVDRKRLAEMQAALDQQRSKVVKLKSVRDEGMVLQRDVENAQRAYEGVATRANQMSLESRTGQTNALVVGQATEPARPVSPKPLVVIGVATVLGLLGGLVLALLREVRDTRVRTDEQASALLQQPLVAVLPRFVDTPESTTDGRRARQLVNA